LGHAAIERRALATELPPVPRVRVNGVELDQVDEGSGIPVVFSHGGSSDRRYWEPQRGPFADHFRFVTYSRRFHGPGEWSDIGDASTEAHVADLVGVIRGLREPVHLVGFSTSLTLRAAIAEPDLVRSLTIVEPNVPWLLENDAEGRTILARWRSDNEHLNADSGGSAERAATLWFELVDNRGPGTFDAQPEDFRRMWMENHILRPPPAPPPDPLTCEQLEAISVPTLAIMTEHGMPYSRRIVEVLASCIPDTELVEIPGATHFVSYQLPSVFNRVVLHFLARMSH
jgi:non-heme chloroperoxidase